MVRAINMAELDFAHCWSILVKIRTGSLAGSAGGRKLFDFQPLLATACLRLSELYHSARVEQNELVKHKLDFSPTFFLQRMRLLGHYATALKLAMQIGKQIGDVFGWFWYQNSRDLLVRHLQRPKVGGFPVGVGGAGEVSFIRTHQVFNGLFIVYHGITDLLRIGDISLVDIGPSGPMVVSIGELKSNQVSDDELQVSIVIYGPPSVSQNEERLPQGQVRTSDPQRLARQMSRMKSAFTPIVPDVRLNSEVMFYHDALGHLARCFRRKRRGTWVRASEGLLVFALPRRRNRSLANRLLCLKPLDPSMFDIPPKYLAGEILLADSTENVFLLDPLEFGGDATWTPAFWLGIDEELLWRTIVGKAWVWAIYNPAFFLAKLRASGVEVEQRSPGQYTLRYHDGSLTMVSNDITRPLSSIRRRLLREESVVEILLEPARSMTKSEIGRFDEIRINLLQYLGRPPV